jgi:hypothetical protein
MSTYRLTFLRFTAKADLTLRPAKDKAKGLYSLKAGLRPFAQRMPKVLLWDDCDVAVGANLDIFNARLNFRYPDRSGSLTQTGQLEYALAGYGNDPYRTE